MADKKEKKDIKEKVKYYLGFITKEELAGFFDRLKKALAEGKKEGEKKILNWRSEDQKMNQKE